MNIDTACKYKAATLIDILDIIFFKIEFNQFYIFLQIFCSEPVPIILK